MSNELEDFEVLLADDFSSAQFCNDILVTVNGQPTTNELDLGTPMKKLRYDLDEVESRIQDTLKNNPNNVIDQMYRGRAVKEMTQNELKSSLDYLNISYQRVQKEVLQPYERAQTLQNVLSKVHQTSILLRDGLVYMHLAGRIQAITERQELSSIDSMLELVMLHSQIGTSLSENANLKSLKLVKQLESETIVPTRKKLQALLSVRLTKALASMDVNLDSSNDIPKLAEAVHTMSPREFSSTIQKSVLSYATTSVQELSRIINSIKNFPKALDKVIKRANSIHKIEQALQNAKHEDTNLLAVYLSKSSSASFRPTRLYWEKVSDAFKKDFEASYRRGGPVGKSLSRSHDMIANTIKEKMTSSTSQGCDQQSINMMLQSISISRS